MKKVIIEFDKFLLQEGLQFEATIIGGAALNILDISSRKTKDVDCLDPKLPDQIKEASKKFAAEREDLELDLNWLNNGPDTLKTDLQLHVLGRADFLKSKLFAYCDRTTPDFEDLKELKPSLKEIAEAMDWVKQRDAHASWPAHVEKAFAVLKKALGYE